MSLPVVFRCIDVFNQKTINEKTDGVTEARVRVMRAYSRNERTKAYGKGEAERDSLAKS